MVKVGGPDRLPKTNSVHRPNWSPGPKGKLVSLVSSTRSQIFSFPKSRKVEVQTLRNGQFGGPDRLRQKTNSVHRPNWSPGQNEKMLSLAFWTRSQNFSVSSPKRSRPSPLEIGQSQRSGPSSKKPTLSTGRAGKWEKVESREEIELYSGQKLELLRSNREGGPDRKTWTKNGPFRSPQVAQEAGETGGV